MNSPVKIIIVMLCLARAATGSDIRSVETQFDRCESTMERINREILRFEEAVERLKRLVERNRERYGDYEKNIVKLENRVDYFRSRFDRSTGQRDKIRTDLNNVSGTTCPSCITSSVDLYCRNSETLTSELEDYFTRVSALEDRITSSTETVPDKEATAKKTVSYVSRRKQTGASIDLHKSLFDACDSGAGKLLLQQCTINLQRADSLDSAGAAEQSLTTLDLVELLLKKAVAACGGNNEQ